MTAWFSWRPLRKVRAATLLLGLLLLFALVVLVANVGEIGRFVELARRTEPGWLLAGLAAQYFTYVFEALSWRVTLRALGREVSLRTLVPLSVAKLFSDQAMPSAGMAGIVFLLGALKRRALATWQSWAFILANMVAHYAAYLLAIWLSFAVLAWHGTLNRLLVGATLLVSAIAIGFPWLVLFARRRGVRLGKRLAHRFPRAAGWLGALASAPALSRKAGLMMRLAALLAMIIVLDTLTLWMMLRGLGQDVTVLVAFTSFVTASMVATLSPVPMGLGTFEAASVGMLHLHGVGLEAALMATILLRGLTLWLPMLPGFWLIRREMRSA